MDTSKFIDFALFFPGFLFSLSFHEAAHGWVANRLGDDTAKSMGRVTLNPLPHMDPIGTLLLPIMGFFWGGFLIGWGVPVPINPVRFRRNVSIWTGMALTAAAGPLSNMLLAVVIAAVIHGVGFFLPQWLDPGLSYNGFKIMQGIVQIFYLNLALAFFNLIPIHPLDGGKIFYRILPKPFADHFDAFMTRYGFVLLLFLFMTGVFRVLVGYPMNVVAGWLL